ncbi:MAG: hypothetical protein N4A47_00790 [Clostridia bacterium]|jgi:hypothetical protein|nr:hypothetical protein [Clostridia bacterium]
MEIIVSFLVSLTLYISPEIPSTGYNGTFGNEVFFVDQNDIQNHKKYSRVEDVLHTDKYMFYVADKFKIYVYDKTKKDINIINEFLPEILGSDMNYYEESFEEFNYADLQIEDKYLITYENIKNGYTTVKLYLLSNLELYREFDISNESRADNYTGDNKNKIFIKDEYAYIRNSYNSYGIGDTEWYLDTDILKINLDKKTINIIDNNLHNGSAGELEKYTVDYNQKTLKKDDKISYKIQTPKYGYKIYNDKYVSKQEKFKVIDKKFWIVNNRPEKIDIIIENKYVSLDKNKMEETLVLDNLVFYIEKGNRKYAQDKFNNLFILRGNKINKVFELKSKIETLEYIDEDNIIYMDNKNNLTVCNKFTKNNRTFNVNAFPNKKVTVSNLYKNFIIFNVNNNQVYRLNIKTGEISEINIDFYNKGYNRTDATQVAIYKSEIIIPSNQKKYSRYDIDSFKFISDVEVLGYNDYLRDVLVKDEFLYLFTDKGIAKVIKNKNSFNLVGYAGNYEINEIISIRPDSVIYKGGIEEVYYEELFELEKKVKRILVNNIDINALELEKGKRISELTDIESKYFYKNQYNTEGYKLDYNNL